ncbi:hypothetical protein CALCODRAFT_355522 [Calocera cornea HHB12733]|uniref:Uncharacterized protein n=1 Tax=Calocera cornea HHB12733 TaxID=1353952 RepID=A0A165ERQ1_9BASI|nr:hypothetical protein CALCODRAFT_355522 [Calocera cornea HHB12733]
MTNGYMEHYCPSGIRKSLWIVKYPNTIRNTEASVDREVSKYNPEYGIPVDREVSKYNPITEILVDARASKYKPAIWTSEYGKRTRAHAEWVFAHFILTTKLRNTRSGSHSSIYSTEHRRNGRHSTGNCIPKGKERKKKKKWRTEQGKGGTRNRYSGR